MRWRRSRPCRNHPSRLRRSCRSRCCMLRRLDGRQRCAIRCQHPNDSYASTNPGLSDATAYPLFYRVVPSDAIQGPAGADAMADAGLDATGLAIMHMTNDYGSGLADAIGAAWNATSGNSLCSFGMVGYEETTTDFSAQAASLAAATDCTGVYLSSYITDAP